MTWLYAMILGLGSAATMYGGVWALHRVFGFRGRPAAWMVLGLPMAALVFLGVTYFSWALVNQGVAPYWAWILAAAPTPVFATLWFVPQMSK